MMLICRVDFSELRKQNKDTDKKQTFKETKKLVNI